VAPGCFRSLLYWIENVPIAISSLHFCQDAYSSFLVLQVRLPIAQQMQSHVIYGIKSMPGVCRMWSLHLLSRCQSVVLLPARAVLRSCVPSHLWVSRVSSWSAALCLIVAERGPPVERMELRIDLLGTWAIALASTVAMLDICLEHPVRLPQALLFGLKGVPW